MNHDRRARRPTRARHKKNFCWPIAVQVLATATLLFCCWTPITAAATAQSTPYACDESKCRATRAHPWVDNDVEYTCWIPQDDVAVALKNKNASSTSPDVLLLEGDEYCADGYVGRIVEDVPPSTIETAFSGEIKTAVWYTCCPPEYPTAGAPVHQTCSDTACSSPDWEGGGKYNDDGVCLFCAIRAMHTGFY